MVSGGTIGGFHKPSGKGSRLIILHAGGENGWIDGAALVFQCKKSIGDYHDEMSAVHFEEWLHDSLIPNLQSNSLVVMDNAPCAYHELKKAADVLAKGIEYQESALKRELFQLICASNPKPKFVVDEMVKAVGHEVVWLPPYHCELNPIELAWSQVKHYNLLKIISYLC